MQWIDWVVVGVAFTIAYAPMYAIMYYNRRG